jgi:hypothetical protein
MSQVEKQESEKKESEKQESKKQESEKEMTHLPLAMLFIPQNTLHLYGDMVRDNTGPPGSLRLKRLCAIVFDELMDPVEKWPYTIHFNLYKVFISIDVLYVRNGKPQSHYYVYFYSRPRDVDPKIAKKPECDVYRRSLSEPDAVSVMRKENALHITLKHTQDDVDVYSKPSVFIAFVS